MAQDREILRTLAGQVAEEAASPRNLGLLKDWQDINSLRADRPLVVVSPEGAWREILPDSALSCRDAQNRRFEWQLRSKLYLARTLRDDTPLNPWFSTPHCASVSGYGFAMEEERTTERGSFAIVPSVRDLQADFARLTHRRLTVDREKTEKTRAEADALFGDLLPVRVRGGHWWTLGLTQDVIKLMGLEAFMLFMYDDPEGLHRWMRFMMEDMDQLLSQYEAEGILTPNNGADMIASGGFGCYPDLVPENFGGPVTCRQLWGFSESQETVSISPEMFGEFIFPYQLPLLERFGLNCYGCCEPFETRWAYLQTIPRLRRLSVSPWSDQAKAAAILKGDYVYSRKPNPAHVCVGFNEAAIRQDLSETVREARDCQLEIILKDTHTVEGDPERFARWVKIAREIVGGR